MRVLWNNLTNQLIRHHHHQIQLQLLRLQETQSHFGTLIHNSDHRQWSTSFHAFGSFIWQLQSVVQLHQMILSSSSGAGAISVGIGLNPAFPSCFSIPMILAACHSRRLSTEEETITVKLGSCRYKRKVFTFSEYFLYRSMLRLSPFFPM